jgi:hypothetical protein
LPPAQRCSSPHRPRSGRTAASLGLATGLQFSGDTSAGQVGYGRPWLAALATLIVTYATGTSLPQSAYQRGDALTTAGPRRS